MSSSEIALNECVRIERDGPVAFIVIDNPPVNAGSWGVRSGLVAAVASVAAEADVQAAVLIGAGSTFIAGSDIKEFDKPLRDPQVPLVISALEACPKPIVAAIHGASLGGGFEIALACDARVTTADAVVGLPEVQLGIIPGAGGTQRVPRLAGVAKAIELIAGGSRVPASEALKLKLIDAIADSDLRAFAARYALGMMGEKRRVRDMPVPASDAAAIRAAIDGALKHGKRNPAIGEAIEMTKKAAELPVDEGLKAEHEIFQRLRASDTAVALRYQFFSERKAGRVSSTAAPRAVSRLGVVGGGTMGAGIAVSFLESGFPVVLVERDAAALDAAKGRVRGIYDRLLSSGRTTQAKIKQRLDALDTSTDFASLAAVDLVVEAVFEDIDIKRDVLRRLDETLRPDAIIGSNTSYLDLNVLGSKTKDPSRLVGLHFFAPANVMRLLEIIRTDRTADDVLATATALARKIRKLPVIARVCEGFIGNRIYSAYRRQCEILLEEGAYPEQVDAALESFGFAMGPFAVTDMSGLDIAWHAQTSGEHARQARALCRYSRSSLRAGPVGSENRRRLVYLWRRRKARHPRSGGARGDRTGLTG